MIEVVPLGGLITIGPGVRVAETPFGTLPRVMWSQVALAVWASVGATIRAMRINAPSALAGSRRIAFLTSSEPLPPAAVHADSVGTFGLAWSNMIVLASADRSTGPTRGAPLAWAGRARRQPVGVRRVRLVGLGPSVPIGSSGPPCRHLPRRSNRPSARLSNG